MLRSKCLGKRLEGVVGIEVPVVEHRRDPRIGCCGEDPGEGFTKV